LWVSCSDTSIFDPPVPEQFYVMGAYVGARFFSSSPSPSLAPSSSCSPELADALSLRPVVLTFAFVCALSVLVFAGAEVAVGLVLIVLCCGGCIFIIYRRWKFIRDKKVSHHPQNKISTLAQEKTSTAGT
jgi:hypothetical protein